jgi:hypothetical protein
MTRTTITTTAITTRSIPHLLTAFRRPRKDSVKAEAPKDPDRKPRPLLFPLPLLVFLIQLLFRGESLLASGAA